MNKKKKINALERLQAFKLTSHQWSITASVDAPGGGRTSDKHGAGVGNIFDDQVFHPEYQDRTRFTCSQRSYMLESRWKERRTETSAWSFAWHEMFQEVNSFAQLIMHHGTSMNHENLQENFGLTAPQLWAWSSNNDVHLTWIYSLAYLLLHTYSLIVTLRYLFLDTYESLRMFSIIISFVLTPVAYHVWDTLPAQHVTVSIYLAIYTCRLVAFFPPPVVPENSRRRWLRGWRLTTCSWQCRLWALWPCLMRARSNLLRCSGSTEAKA